MPLRTPAVCGLVALTTVVALCFTPRANSNQPPVDPPNKTNDDLRAKVRELEERLARIEKRLAQTKIVSEAVPFGEVVSNLGEERLQRYLRCKISLEVDADAQQEVTNAVTKKKAELRNWMVGYLADQTLKSVSGSQNIQRIRSDIKNAFGRILFPNRKANPIKEILFEEYIVQ